MSTPLVCLAFAASLATAAACHADTDTSDEIVCAGKYRHHLQGIATDETSAIYWSFTTTLVKTDLKGELIKAIDVPYHHGDLCVANGKVYVAQSDSFNKPGADSRVCVYDAKDLSLLDTRKLHEVDFGAGGMEYHKGHFFVIGGLPPEHTVNYVYEYDADFRHVATHTIESGYTNLGIQTVCFHEGRWWFGCYTLKEKPRKGLLVTDEQFNLLGMYDVSPSIGIDGWRDGKLLVAKHFGEQWQAKVVLARPDDTEGLTFK